VQADRVHSSEMGRSPWVHASVGGSRIPGGRIPPEWSRRPDVLRDQLLMLSEMAHSTAGVLGKPDAGKAAAKAGRSPA